MWGRTKSTKLPGNGYPIISWMWWIRISLFRRRISELSLPGLFGISGIAVEYLFSWEELPFISGLLRTLFSRRIFPNPGKYGKSLKNERKREERNFCTGNFFVWIPSMREKFIPMICTGLSAGWNSGLFAEEPLQSFSWNGIKNKELSLLSISDSGERERIFAVPSLFECSSNFLRDLWKRLHIFSKWGMIRAYPPFRGSDIGSLYGIIRGAVLSMRLLKEISGLPGLFLADK